MHVEKIDELIRVFADFHGKCVKPVAFLRPSGRRYGIEKVNLVYRTKVGDHYHWCFACSSQGNTFVLFYNPEALEWHLREVHME